MLELDCAVWTGFFVGAFDGFSFFFGATYLMNTCLLLAVLATLDLLLGSPAAFYDCFASVFYNTIFKSGSGLTDWASVAVR